MAVTLYTTAAEVKASSTLTGTTYVDADIDLAIEAASRAVDLVCRRRFWVDDDVNQVRYYDPTGPDLVRIDDLVTLTALAVDIDADGTYTQTWTVGTDFVLSPANAVADARPYELIERRTFGRYSFPTEWERPVKVTGKFGWAAVPAPVEQATKILAARLVKRTREAPFGVVTIGIDAGSGTMHAARIASKDPDIRGLLFPTYVRGGRRFG